MACWEGQGLLMTSPSQEEVNHRCGPELELLGVGGSGESVCSREAAGRVAALENGTSEDRAFWCPGLGVRNRMKSPSCDYTLRQRKMEPVSNARKKRNWQQGGRRGGGLVTHRMAIQWREGNAHLRKTALSTRGVTGQAGSQPGWWPWPRPDLHCHLTSARIWGRAAEMRVCRQNAKWSQPTFMGGKDLSYYLSLPKSCSLDGNPGKESR